MKCRRCGDSSDRRICPNCLRAWTDMRVEVFRAIERLQHGVLCPDNFEQFKKVMRRMDRLWKSDRETYAAELLRLKMDSENEK